DLYQVREEEERRKLEWIVERDISQVPRRVQVMAWSRGGEDDWRFRKALLASLAVSLLLGALLPMIDLPLPERFEIEDVPKRLAQLVREEQAKPVPPPRVVEEAPPEETKPQEQKPKPAEQRKPLPPETPAYAEAKPVAPQKKAEKAGILAFRDKFASLAQDKVAPRLGADARFSTADDASKGPSTRSMLTTNAPGSSGGINLASLSRNVGGGGGGGGGGGEMQGVQVGQATSSIASIGGGDRPLAHGGPGLSRTDEEIQIVFDRYKASFYRLYNRELRKDPTLRGQMVLRLTIEPDGRVSMCALQASDMNAPELSAQVVDRVLTINFGAKEDVQALTIVYPIDFLPAA
ncbi:MAG: AgmX/PglI C-terminal domain-containing protein, partial [Woeseiaceae bacterium]